MVGQPATASELLLNFLLGFLLGYKILALFIMDSSATEDPQAFIFSGIGSWPAGIVLGLLFAGLKMVGKKQTKIAKTRKKNGADLAAGQGRRDHNIALVFGLLGAKLFDIFENWSDFLKHPLLIFFLPQGLLFMVD